MYRKPLVVLCLCFISGLLLGPSVPLPLSPLVASVVLTGSGFLLLALHKKYPGPCSIGHWSMLVALGIMIYNFHSFPSGDLYSLVSGMDQITGVIVSYPKIGPKESTWNIKPKNHPGKLRVSCPNEICNRPTIEYGNKIRIVGKFSSPPKFPNFNYRSYLRRHDIWGLVEASRVEVLATDRAKNPVLDFGWGLRKGVFSLIEENFGSESNQLKAIMFGSRKSLKERLKRHFTRSGLNHLLATSGLHLGILLGLAWGVLQLLGVKNTLKYGITFPPLILYLFTVGFKTSLVRVAVLYSLRGIRTVAEDRGWILSTWSHPFQELAGAALILLMINPLSMFDAGFQISFTATFSISLFYGDILKLLKDIPWSYLRNLISASVAAQLGVMPIVVHCFGKFHPWTILFNIGAIPLEACILYGAVISLPVIDLPLLNRLTWLEFQALKFNRKAIHYMGNMPFASIDTPDIPPRWTALYLLLLLGLKLRLGRETRRD